MNTAYEAMRCLSEHPDGITVKRMAKAIPGADGQIIRNAIMRMLRRGEAEKIGRGTYRLTERGRQRLALTDSLREQIVALPWSSVLWDSHHVWWLIRAPEGEYYNVSVILVNLAEDGFLAMTTDKDKKRKHRYFCKYEGKTMTEEKEAES